MRDHVNRVTIAQWIQDLDQIEERAMFDSIYAWDNSKSGRAASVAAGTCKAPTSF